MIKPIRSLLCAAALFAGLAACAPPQARMGMVTDDETNLMYGSSIDGNLITDATFFTNKKIKIRSRNTSGDVQFGLRELEDRIAAAYEGKGYTPSLEDDFGLLMDVNVLYSGHIQQRAVSELGFFGAVAGGALSARAADPVKQTHATLAGASIGAILGTHVSDDTYMIISEITFGIVKKARKTKKRITFSRSEKLKNIDDPDEEEKVYARGFKKKYKTRLTVYAGGRNVKQREIVAEVKNRMIRIVSDFL